MKVSHCPERFPPSAPLLCVPFIGTAPCSMRHAPVKFGFDVSDNYYWHQLVVAGSIEVPHTSELLCKIPYALYIARGVCQPMIQSIWQDEKELLKNCSASVGCINDHIQVWSRTFSPVVSTSLNAWLHSVCWLFHGTGIRLSAIHVSTQRMACCWIEPRVRWCLECRAYWSHSPERGVVTASASFFPYIAHRVNSWNTKNIDSLPRADLATVIVHRTIGTKNV